MPYQYYFDNARAGDLHLSTADLRILRQAYGLFRDDLRAWNRRALANGASSPYKREVDDLTHMIEWVARQSDQARMGGVVVQGVSVGNLQYIKAALLLMVWKREQDYANRVREGWPSAALKSLTESIDEVKKFAAEINYEPNDVLWELIPMKAIISENEAAKIVEWDVFISHASEDKDGFVRPLAEGLRKLGLKVWFDEFTLAIGDSLRRSIDRGLAHSRFGVVVISADFLRKEWPKKELDGLVAREVEGVKVILPVWHGISADDIRAHSPTLADRVATSSQKGLQRVIDELVGAIRLDDESQSGIGGANGHSPGMQRNARRESPGAMGSTQAAGLAAAEIADLWVNTDYPQKLGLIEKLKADGYDVQWEGASGELTAIDLEGWEHVIIDRPDGTRARLKVRDPIGEYVVLLKRRKGIRSA
jgi:hypothetical protein